MAYSMNKVFGADEWSAMRDSQCAVTAAQKRLGKLLLQLEVQAATPHDRMVLRERIERARDSLISAQEASTAVIDRKNRSQLRVKRQSVSTAMAKAYSTPDQAREMYRWLDAQKQAAKPDLLVEIDRHAERHVAYGDGSKLAEIGEFPKRVEPSHVDYDAVIERLDRDNDAAWARSTRGRSPFKNEAGRRIDVILV